MIVRVWETPNAGKIIPKSRPLSTGTDEELVKIERLRNTQPRKRLGYKTPLEIFMSSLNRVALRA